MPSAMPWLQAAAVAAAGLASAAAQAPAAASADYVIVGGGTAGCVLAAKLCTGLPDAKIVLLERAAPRSAEAVRLPFSSPPRDLPMSARPASQTRVRHSSCLLYTSPSPRD